MELRLATLIEAIFVFMGTPDTTVRQCPLALDKWLELIVASRQRMLGLIVDTNSLTVGIPPDYVAKVFDLLNKHHMAFSPPSFHHRGSTKAYRKIGPSGRGRQ